VARHDLVVALAFTERVSCLAEMIRMVVGIKLLEGLPCDAVISADLMFRYAFLRSPGNARDAARVALYPALTWHFIPTRDTK
jgi:hypothetical protein